MEIDAVGKLSKTPDVTPVENQSESSTAVPVQTAESIVAQNQLSKDLKEEQRNSFEGKEREPSKSTLDSALSDMNTRIKKTRCEYAYDETTKRVSIKVYDKKTDELIREVPPEKSLEMLQKMWELAGIIVDERR